MVFNQGFTSVDSYNKFNNDNLIIPKVFVNQIFQYCVCHNELDEKTGLHYDWEAKEKGVLEFNILQDLQQNNRYLVTKQLFDLTCNI